MAANPIETTSEEVKDDALEVEIVESLEEEAEVKAEDEEVVEADVEEDVETKDDVEEDVEVKADDEEIVETDVKEDVETKDDVEEVLSALVDDVETKEVEVDEMRIKRLTELGIENPESVDPKAFYCAESKSMEIEVHDDCRGGCAPEDNLPGLLDVEIMASKEYGGEIVRSGYAANEAIYFVDVKREDGKYIEIAYANDGEALGWNLLNSETIEKKSLENPEAITMATAEEIALKEYPGTVLGVETALFEGIDSYVVDISTTDGKSLDVFVGLDGDLVGIDTFLFDDEDVSEKAMAAPAAAAPVAAAPAAPAAAAPAAPADDTKKLAEMIGTIKSADQLAKVIQAIGKDVDQVPAEIRDVVVMKAQELKATQLLPEAWKKKPEAVAPAAAAPAVAPAPAAPMPEKSLSAVVDGEVDEEFAAKVAEFTAMTDQETE